MKKRTFVIAILIFVLSLALFGCTQNTDTDGDSEPTSFGITVGEIEHGLLTTDKATAAEGETVTLAYSADSGYVLYDVLVDGKPIEHGDGTATFTMPAENVIVSARFIEEAAFIQAEVPDKYAFILNAYLDKVMAKSAWTYRFDETEKVLDMNVWVQDTQINEEQDGIKVYFGTPTSVYAPGAKNFAVEAYGSGKTAEYSVRDGEYAEGDVDGIDVAVKPWTVDGKEYIGYNVNISVKYSVFGITGTGRGNITMLPKFINGNKTSQVPVTTGHTDAGEYTRPNTYLLLTGNNACRKNLRYTESATFGAVSGVNGGDKWQLECDTDSGAPDRIVTLKNTDGKDNNLVFRHTYGANAMYAEAKFKVTRIYSGERWGKFGFMLFDGAANNGLYCYVDAYVGGEKNTAVENISGSGLGYNHAINGWRSWNDIVGSVGSLDLSDDTITMRLAYIDNTVYLYVGDALVFTYKYTVGNAACLGIKSFNYGLEITDYYATTDVDDAKFKSCVPTVIDYSSAISLTNSAALTVSDSMTVTKYSKNLELTEGEKIALYVKNNDPLGGSACSVLFNGKTVEPKKVYTAANEYSLRYDLTAASGENTVALAYITCPKDMKIKLVKGETDITGALADWTKTETPATVEDKPAYYFLGSSVTYGAANKGVSFAEKIASALGVECVKEAVSGTTLADTGDDSYVDRLKKLDTAKKIEELVVQLSTNDASQNIPLGKVSDSRNLADFDVTTTIGAMEYIIAYARETWGVNVTFYTNPKYQNDNYIRLVAALYEVRDKWGIDIVDFYAYRDMTALTAAQLDSYMDDPIHPNDKGYEWMSSVFQARLVAAFERRVMTEALTAK